MKSKETTTKASTQENNDDNNSSKNSPPVRALALCRAPSQVLSDRRLVSFSEPTRWGRCCSHLTGAVMTL